MGSQSARGSAGPEAAYAQAFKDVENHVSLDIQWSKVRAAIESHCGLLGKQPAVRVKNWLKKLSEETANVVWKKNRNAYARLLLEQLRCGKLGEPFSGQPPGGPLPTLPKHLAYAFKPPRSSSPRSAQAVQAQAAAAVQFEQQLVQPPRQPVVQQRAPGAQQQQQRHLSATEQLDEYLGRADFRRAEFAETQAQMARAAASARAIDSDDGSSLGYIPGTRMQLRGAEGRRVDRHQLADVGWQPSKLELEAQLGASRERQAELEWRLGQMEGLLRQHGMVLGGQASAPPLGSLLDAIDDGHVSPPRQRSGKKELEELIDRFEAKRRQWQSPSWAASTGARQAAGSPTRQRPPPIAYSDEVEILQQLDNFQRQTETIRQQLGGGGASASSYSASQMVQPPGSSLAAHTSSGGTDWEQVLESSTPARQQPTGLRGGGYTPRQPAVASSMALFDGLPPTPGALAASRAAGNRHVQHAGHHLRQGSPPHLQQQQQQQAAPMMQQHHQHHQQADPPSPVQAPGISSRLTATMGAPAVQQQQQQQQQRPRSPIGPEIRHTKKSAAAAERASASMQPPSGSAAALQRLKTKRQSAVGAALPPGSQALPELEEGAGNSQAVQEQQPQVPLPPQQALLHASVQARQLQHDEGVQVHPGGAHWETEVGVQAPTPPAAAHLPPDSNEALVAEVRQLRSKLLASLQKHAPELAAAGISSSIDSGLAAAQKRQAEQLRAEQAGRPDSSWRVAAMPSALASAAAVAASAPDPTSTVQPPESASASASRRLTDPWGSDWPAPGAGTGVGASRGSGISKFRLTDDSMLSGAGVGGIRHRLTDLSSFGVGGASASSGSGGLTPSSLLGCGGGSSFAALDSLDAGSSLGIVQSSFDLGSFEAQTEALRRRLSAC